MPLRLHAAETASIGVPENLGLPAPENLGLSILTLDYLFAGGPAPTCQDAVDTNDDGTVNIADPVYSLSFLFLGGPVPVEPFGECGRDPTEDGLDCASFLTCR